MKGSNKFWYSVFVMCLIQSFYWIITLRFIGPAPSHDYFYDEVWFYEYTWYQQTITIITMILWIVFIFWDATSLEKKESERPLRWVNQFYYINKLANKYLSD